MRKLLAFFLISSATFAATQSQMPLKLGWTPIIPSNFGLTMALTSTQTWLALGFIPTASGTINKLRLPVSAVTGGTLGANDLVAAIYSDSGAGVPGSSLSSTNTVTTTPSGASEVEFTGLSQAVTQGTQYHVVLTNANSSCTSTANSCTVYPTYRYGNTNTGAFPISGSSSVLGWTARQSTNGGTSWGTGDQFSWGLRIQYASGFDGMPITNIAATLATTDRVYGTQEAGVKCTAPQGVNLNVIGLSMFVGRVGTPTGEIEFKLYNGNTLAAITVTNIPETQVAATSSPMMFPLYFSADATIAPGAVFRVVRAETTQSNTSANYYEGMIYSIDNDSNSFGLMAFGGTCGQTYTAVGATTVGLTATFTDASTAIEPFLLILDFANPFSSAAAGSGSFSVE